MSLFKYFQNKFQKTEFHHHHQEEQSPIQHNTKLNFSIFIEVIIYLIYYNLNDFNRVLRLALISKSTFRIVKNTIISYRFSKYQFIIPHEKDLINYIKYKSKHNLELDDDQIYQLKLIQYKDIEHIRLQSHLDYQDYRNDIHSKKVYLKEYCKNLKQVKILQMFQFQDISYSYGQKLTDFTQNGLYKFKWLMWDSNLIKPKIQLFKPKKLFLFSNMAMTTEQENELLECDFIKTFKFFNVNTPDGFISKTISNRAGVSTTTTTHNIKSLTIRVNPKSFIFPELADGQQDQPIAYEKIDFSNNKNLKKLIILIKVNDNLFHQHPMASTVSTCPKSLFSSLELNQSIEKLGLIGYNIQDSKILKPLLNLNNINTLYCDISDVKVLNAHLTHCNKNSNIKKLHLSDYYQLMGRFNKPQILLILKFIKDNHHSLNQLVFSFNHKYYINLLNNDLDDDLETKLFFELFSINKLHNNENYYFNKHKVLICKLKL